MWGVVVAFAIVTAVWSHHVGVPIRDPGGSMFARRVALSLGLFAVFCVLDAVVRTRRRGWTVARVASELRARWSLGRVALAVTGLLAYHLVYLSYHNLKSWTVFNSPKDDQLLRLDRWLFFDHSPATLLHDLIGQHVAAYVLAVVYESFSYMVAVSFVAALVFAPRIRDGYVFVTSAIWTWILGVGSYYLIPSLGPFATAPEEFARLSHTFIISRQETLTDDRAHLLQQPAAGDAFASISAFASLHIGFTFMILLMLRYYGFRRSAQAMTVYLVVTSVATVYFGYHFVIDLPAGLLVGYLAVRLGRLTVYPGGGDGVRSRPVAAGPD